MDLFAVIIIGIVVAASGVINPKTNDPEEIAKVPETQVTTPVVKEPELQPEPTPAPEPEPEPQPEPTPAPEPEPEPQPEPQQEEPKAEVNAGETQEQDAKPEEEIITPTQDETTEANEDKGLSMLNIILYILGAIAVIAAGIYFFMRREPEQSAADIARSQSQEPTPKPQEEQPAQEETYSEPVSETEQPAQEETQTETTETEENSTSEDTNDQSSNNDDENNNR
jgi:uncharacterized protein HemX